MRGSRMGKFKAEIRITIEWEHELHHAPESVELEIEELVADVLVGAQIIRNATVSIDHLDVKRKETL